MSDNIAIGSYDLSQLSTMSDKQIATDVEIDKIKPVTENVVKYITFKDGEIIVGSSDSNIKLKIDNDSVDLLNSITNAILCSFNSEITTVKNLSIANNLKVWDYSFKHDENGNIFFGRD